MKKPRFEDFDPNHDHTPPLHSGMEHLPPITSPPKKIVLPLTQSALPTTTTTTRTDVQTYARTPSRRTITRYAFEFYQDQIERLQAFSLEEKMRGGKGSMSALVREALDDFFRKSDKPETP